MKRLLLLTLILIIPVLLFCQDSGYITILPAEAYAMMEEGEPLLLDVRTPGEYATQHCPGDHRLGKGRFPGE